ncbi:hypothetical protein [Halorussus halophilus]|uniref:hypothetical protein n=1 Tax=Halorussus halophilus TaxID=2650975 RepID=UPI003742A87E
MSRGGGRARRLRQLELRVARLEEEVQWLRRAVEANGESLGTLAVGPCPKCESGVLVRHDDDLHCTVCGYTRYL